MPTDTDPPTDPVACPICGTFDALDDVAWSAHCHHPPAAPGLRTVATLSDPYPDRGNG